MKWKYVFQIMLLMPIAANAAQYIYSTPINHKIYSIGIINKNITDKVYDPAEMAGIKFGKNTNFFRQNNYLMNTISAKTYSSASMLQDRHLAFIGGYRDIYIENNSDITQTYKVGTFILLCKPDTDPDVVLGGVSIDDEFEVPAHNAIKHGSSSGFYYRLNDEEVYQVTVTTSIINFRTNETFRTYDIKRFSREEV